MDQIPKYQALQEAMAQAYADAVVCYLKSREPQEIAFTEGTFTVSFVDPGTSPTDVDMWVGNEWDCWLEGIQGADLGRLGEAQFRARIVDQLLASQTTLELLAFFFNREDE